MKQIKLFTIAVTLLITNSLTAQTQKKLWSLPSNYIKFTSGPGAVTALPTTGDYQGDVSNQPHNAMHDSNGDLLFFVTYVYNISSSDYSFNVYDKNGDLVGPLVYGSTNVSGGSEIALVPVPNDCNKYFIICSINDCVGTTSCAAKFGYATLDVSTPNSTSLCTLTSNVVLINSSVSTSNHDDLSNFAVTPLRAATNDRLIFATQGGILYKYQITQSGFTALSTSGTDVLPVGTSNPNVKTELEVITLSSGNYRLANSSTFNVGISEFTSAGVMTGTTQSYNLGGTGAGRLVHGLEFSPNGAYLYVAHEQSPYMQYINVSTGVVTSLGSLSNASLFGSGQIELGSDNKLYYCNSGQLGSLPLNTSGTIGSPITGSWTASAVSSLNMNAAYLNDQVDGEIYFPVAPTISGNGYACNTTAETYTLGGGYNSAYTYLWTVTGGTPSSFTTSGTTSSQPITWSSANGGTISVQTVGFGTCPVTFTVDTCCRRSPTHSIIPIYLNDKLETVNGLYTATSYPLGATGNYMYVINGTYTVNSTIGFSGCNVYLAPDAQVIINSGGTLNLTSNTVWSAGCGAMWNGIIINNGGTLLVDNSTIQDAKMAIDCKSGGQLTTQNQAKLKVNYKNIWLESISTGTHTATIKNTTISCLNSSNVAANALIAPYAGQRTASGIFVDNVPQANIGVDATGQTNTFNNLDVGIFNLSSGLTVYNNTFTNMTLAAASTGYGIYSWNLSTSEKTLVVGGSANTYQKNTFTNSNSGVYALTNQDVSVINNVINNLTTGITVYNCYGSGNQISLNSNTIDDSNTGIYAYGTGGSTSLDITLNNINSSTCSTNCKPNSKAISVSNASLSTNGTAPTMTIINNTIKRVSTGVEVSNYTAPSLRDNTITALSDLTSSGPQSNGIYITNCPQLDIEHNLVTGSSGSAWWENGIRIEPGTTGMTMIYNGVEDVGRGLFFSGTLTTGTQTANNNMKNNLDGYLLNNSIVGIQLGTSGACKAAENTWQGTFGNSHIFSNSSIGTSSPMNILTSGTTGYTTDMLTPGTIVSLFSGGPGFAAVPTSTCSTRSGYTGTHRSMEESKIDVVKSLLLDTVVYPVYLAANKWWNKYNLYNTLRGDSTLLADASLQIYSDSMQNTSIGKLYYVNQLVNTQTDPTLVTNPIQDIVSENSIEQNMKDVYQIIISEKLNQNLNDAEIGELKRIAMLCPYEEGPAVYNARAILSGIDSISYINPCEIVLPFQGRRMNPLGNITDENVINVFPNPANDKIGIDVVILEGEKATFEICDLTGKKIVEQSLSTGSEIKEISTSQLSQGLYIYKLNINNKNVYNGKISILH